MSVPNLNVVTEQLTAAGRAIEHDSFAVIDREVESHAYTEEQWPIVRRMIHANADFDFNGLTDFHPDGVSAGVAAILSRTTRVVADVEMICVGLSAPRLGHFGMGTHQFISDPDVIDLAKAEGIIPALESSHAVAQALKIAADATEPMVLLVNLSGRGDKDLAHVHSVLAAQQGGV